MATNVKPSEQLEIEDVEGQPQHGHGNAPLHHENILSEDQRAPEARGKTIDSIPNSYWYSWSFLGTFAAIILSKDAGSGGFSLAAPVLARINEEIGPDPDYTWVSLSWTLTQGVSALIVGRLSDVFGRRWIFIIGSLIGTIGSVWASQATSIKQLIGATVMLGVAGGVQISYFWILSEIVPMRWRFAALSVLYAFSFTSWIGPKISYDFYNDTNVQWRGSYYLLIALNGASTLLFWACYHPPTFKMLHRRRAFMDLIRYFDWLGLILYTAGFTLFIIGINWGGNRYDWDTVEVLATLICGVLGLVCFLAYEYFLPRFTKKIVPFVEMHLFTNVPFLAITGMSAVANSSYYGLASVWPGLVNNVWVDLDHDEVGNMLSLYVLTYTWGQVVGGSIAHFTGPKRPVIISMLIAAPLLGAVASNPMDMTLTSVLIGLGSFSLGIMEGIAITATTYPLRSQEELGTAGGVSGTIRHFVATVATAVYNTVLRNRTATTMNANVRPAVLQKGLPQSSVEPLISALESGSPINDSTVPGITNSILVAARYAFRVAYSQAYRTVFFVCIGFTLPGVILCWFIVDSDLKQNEFVAGHLHKRADEKDLEREEDKTIEL